LVNSFNVHIGIVNFYPVMFGLIEDKERVKASLKVLADPEIMLSKSGIRSLSKGDQFYLHRSNYWRGAIWINVNFLTLRGLY
jgi:mannosyl-oligosaccharide glucosidase